MELIVKEAIEAPVFVPNSFTVHITVMHGDADLYTRLTMDGFDASSPGSLELLKKLLHTLDKMKDAFIHTGRGGNKDERYALKVPEFEPWFSLEDLTEDYCDAVYKPNSQAGAEHLMQLAQAVNKHYAKNGFSEWPDDATMGQSFGLHNESTIEKYEVRYIDAAGVQHTVEIQG